MARCGGEGRTEVLGRGGEEEGGEWDWWEAENHGSEGGRNWRLGRSKLAAVRPKTQFGIRGKNRLFSIS